MLCNLYTAFFIFLTYYTFLDKLIFENKNCNNKDNGISITTTNTPINMCCQNILNGYSAQSCKDSKPLNTTKIVIANKTIKTEKNNTKRYLFNGLHILYKLIMPAKVRANTCIVV